MNRALGKYFYVTVAAIVLSISVTAQVDERTIGGGVGITVFKDRDFRGSTVTYTRNMPNLRNTGFDNNISSLRIGPNETWEVCDGVNFSGQCVVVSGEERDLGVNNWSNKISSFRRVSGGGGGTTPPNAKPYIVLFEQPNFRGNPRSYDYAAGNLSGSSRSVTIGSGVWELCDGYNYSGRCQTVTMSQANLANIGLSRVRSVRPKESTSPAPAPGSDWYVVLFAQANFRGSPTNYKTARSNIVKTTGSVTIGKGVWELCTGSNYTGTCRTLDSSVANMQLFGVFSRTIRSLRPVIMREPR